MASEPEPDDEDEDNDEDSLEENLKDADAEKKTHGRVRPVIDPTRPVNFADELGVIDITEPVFGGRGRLFSVAGRNAPIAEFTNDFLVLHPPQKPFNEDGPAEVITSHQDNRGVLLDELGREKTIPGARFKGQQLYWLAEHKPGTLKHIAGWIDERNKAHRLFSEGEVMLVDDVFKLRNRTHDGELSIYPHLSTE
ncbi:MAG: hypothetical protein P4L53_29310 [Candidatus Obscuribacterales bacterium]|nr:hypothetical protein [Candidatus Obscuribacterales bacterium]